MNPQQRVAAAIKRVPGWRADEVRYVASLGGGPSSETLLVERRSRRFVLRIDSVIARQLGLDRKAELRAHRAAADEGLAPEIEFASPQDGILITRYVAGRAWQAEDLRDARKLGELAARLRDLHALTPDVRGFDLAGALRRYARSVASEQAYAWAGEGEDLLAQLGHRDARLCHNDLVAQNIVEGERLWLIDWEYAALGDPLFDLAVVVAHHDLNDACRDALLTAWCGGDGEAHESAAEGLRIYVRVYARLLALWQAVVRRNDEESSN